ncbi:molybdopterin biosynthesis protein [Thermodesulfovibrionales bacterium]|nr:molybdopterin biosynthesis protein [Thermodesulfovibrionales bacterium]MCL0070968.1 molybdopterin biosynthesis protein [Thermodesulfovibrionales bacterium]MCL0087046.1 molybdopterin biosynthesis protein [Thermodesulfovibrionales bacterium]
MNKDYSKQVFSDILPVEKSFELLLERLDFFGIHRLSPETIHVNKSQGRITAEPIFAKYSSPFYHSAAMDGYAVRFTDTFSAIETSPCMLKVGTAAVPVNTGDPIPQGFNAVIMIEDVNVVNDCIEIYRSVTPYQHVRVIGEDIVTTELIIPENHKIRPIDIGAMLASGHLEVAVRKRPVVAIIPTGTEIIEPDVVRDRPPKPPEIIEYNSAVLSGLAMELGAEAKRFGIVRDDLEEIKEAIKEATKVSDIVLVNAGVGRGSEDFTATAIEQLGAVIVHGVSIKPGKPLVIGFVNNRPVFGMPGYPVSAYLAFQMFVRPTVARLLGVVTGDREKVAAKISRQLSSQMGVDEFIRVKVGVVGGEYITTPVGRGAGLMMSLVKADGIVRIPASSEGLQAGTKVEVELIRSKGEIKNTIVCIGSHDNSLDILANTIKKRYPEFSLSSAHVGSMGGLIALGKGEAHIAGTHLLDEQSGEYNVPFIKRLLPNKEILIVNLLYRQQGLLVKSGNPKKIKGFRDLIRDDIVFINRQVGSGTRLLLDKHLRELGINPSMIKGYERAEYTHMTVASDVLTGLADTGLAIYSSAKALGLDFIPVANERYDLAIPYEFIDTEMIKVVLKIIREDEEFRGIVRSLGGYDTRDMGKVIVLN